MLRITFGTVAVVAAMLVGACGGGSSNTAATGAATGGASASALAAGSSATASASGTAATAGATVTQAPGATTKAPDTPAKKLGTSAGVATTAKAPDFDALPGAKAAFGKLGNSVYEI